MKHANRLGSGRPLWPYVVVAIALEGLLLLAISQWRSARTLALTEVAPVVQVALRMPAPALPEAPVEAAPPDPTPEPPSPRQPERAIRPAPKPLANDPPVPPPEPASESHDPVEVAAVAPQPVAPAAAPEPVIATTPAAPAADEVERYVEEVRRAVASKRRYPALARRRGLEGSVVVWIRIDANGGLDATGIVEARVRLLEKPTLQAARRAAPYPPPPGGSMTIEVPLEYSLED